ncbi:hypothetical protein BDW02DRAFT_574005 [Decorospora gaudefroyi]|uniref:Glyoxalase-like domain-containing protein n=1 Tax=Decorospora gaudefroyi TaxID=184978 RepID=A0A6A5JYJ5_9PLEO|nr:hypothetical protein BDW02DRAFT_574005 [Decorospora gaudefroyi]
MPVPLRGTARYVERHSSTYKQMCNLAQLISIATSQLYVVAIKMSWGDKAKPRAPTRLRQIALVTEDAERAKHLLTHVLGTEVVFEDAAVGQWGLKNFLVPLGGDLIEVVSPIREGTTAGRLLEKRGEGGYMVIMQTEDAKRRRKYIEAERLASVIFEHEQGDAVCIQYHPKGIKGGMMPELDSHTPGPNNPTPVRTRFSPWHACGPHSDGYTPAMERTQHLTLERCVLRLQPGDPAPEDAAGQWEAIFGVAATRDWLAFTNTRMRFIAGSEGLPAGLVSITIGVQGKDEYEAMVQRARDAGVWRDRDGCGCLDMCGIEWYLALLTAHDGRRGKL